MFEPGLIHVNELWTDQAPLDRHFGSPYIAEWRAALPDLRFGERNLRV